jgi:hypothetical protein
MTSADYGQFAALNGFLALGFFGCVVIVLVRAVRARRRHLRRLAAL